MRLFLEGLGILSDFFFFFFFFFFFCSRPKPIILEKSYEVCTTNTTDRTIIHGE